ncbi:hypothetical protein STENM223S_10395 [Streptomyces tendae]
MVGGHASGPTSGGSPITFVDQRGLRRRVSCRPGLRWRGRRGPARGARPGAAPAKPPAHRVPLRRLDRRSPGQETPTGVRVTFLSTAARTRVRPGDRSPMGCTPMSEAGLQPSAREERYGGRHLRLLRGRRWPLPTDVPGPAGRFSRLLNPSLAGLPPSGADHRDPARAGAFFVFGSTELRYDRHDVAQQKKLIRDAFAGLALAGAPAAGEPGAGPRAGTSTRSCRADVPASVLQSGRPARRRRLRGRHRRHGHRRAPWWRRTSWPASWPGPEATTAPPSPATSTPCVDYAQGCQKGGDRTGPFLAPGTATGLRCARTGS